VFGLAALQIDIFVIVDAKVLVMSCRTSKIAKTRHVYIRKTVSVALQEFAEAT
jgi:hypothetical protein